MCEQVSSRFDRNNRATAYAESPFNIEKLNMLLKKRYYAKYNVTLAPPTTTTEAASRRPRAYSITTTTMAPTTPSTTPTTSKATTSLPSLPSSLSNYVALPEVAAAPPSPAATSNGALSAPHVQDLVDLGLTAEQAIPAFQEWSRSLQSAFKQVLSSNV